MTPSNDDVRTQYQDDRNLNARIALHAQYSTNPYGWQRWVFDHIDLPATAHVLELGCGPGGLWTANRERVPEGWRMTMTDASPGMVATAHGNLAPIDGRFSFATADALTIAFPDNAFDGVIANHMLYHVPDRARALAEIRRVLTPAGRLFATTVGESHMHEMWALLASFVPDIHTRVTQVSQGFTLENGGAQLERVFGEVTRADYPDNLVVTEVQPVIDYIRSSNTLMGCSVSPNEWAAIRRQITAHIDFRGAFHIQKASGLFVAHS